MPGYEALVTGLVDERNVKKNMETPRRSQQRRIKQTVHATLQRIRNRQLNECDVPIKRTKLDMSLANLVDIEITNPVNLDIESNIPVQIRVPEDPISLKEVRLSLNNLENNSSKIDDICNWAVTNNVTHSALNQLLSIFLKWEINLPFPKDSRTLLKTPRKLDILNIGGGEYFYFGIEKSIVKCLAIGLSDYFVIDSHKNLNNLITLQIGIDGLPLSKSSTLQFWPILGKVDQCSRYGVFLIGLYCGYTKPCEANEFLKPFVSEMCLLEENGVSYKSVLYNIRVRCIVADAPARSFIKHIKGHNAYYGCERCYRKGKWFKRFSCQM